MTAEKVVYPDAIISTVDAARDKLSPRIMQRLKDEAGYEDGVKRPSYPISTMDRIVKIFAAELYAGVPPDEAQYRVGQLAMKRYGDSTVGKALMPLIRMLGPMRFLKRLPSMFRQANNYADVQVEVTGPTTFLLHHNEVSELPHYFRGVMQASIALIGLKDPQCQLLEYDGHRARYEVSWRA